MRTGAVSALITAPIIITVFVSVFVFLAITGAIILSFIKVKDLFQTYFNPPPFSNETGSATTVAGGFGQPEDCGVFAWFGNDVMKQTVGVGSANPGIN